MPDSDKKVVLIVDDEELFLKTVADGFSAYADRTTLLTAPNGKVAVELLERSHVDIVVTDLKMPEMDGFGLIAHMSRAHPEIPVIVMTAFGTPEIEQDLEEHGIIQVMDKPIDFPELAAKVLDTLVDSAAGHLAGIALPTFLQMVEMDRKTCTVRVSNGEEEGRFYFKRGVLANAEIGGRDGADAAMEIAVWERPEIDILSGPIPKVQDLSLSVSEILLQAFRLQDERGRQRLRAGRARAKQTRSSAPAPSASAPSASAPSVPAPPVPAPRVPAPRVSAPKVAVKSTPAQPAISDSSSGPVGPSSKERKKEKTLMSANEKLKELGSIDGFTGVALYTPQGELLAMHASDMANLEDIGVLANNVLMNAQKASIDMGTGRGQQVHVEAENANIFVRCLNEGNDPLHSQPGKAHIHMVLVVNKDAPIGMAKLKMNATIQKLADDFRF